jgi:autotransporter-associated beta strand protein
VKLLGREVGLVGQASVDASGRTGGGTVLVGGGFQGQNPGIQNAEATYVGADARIAADATEAGRGGTAIVWADGATRFAGTASARGGASAGDGGLVEVSGKDWLAFTGRVDTSAPAGQAGTLLLDPTNVTISAAATSNGTCPAVGPCFTLTGNPATAVLNVTDLVNALVNTNVTVSTSSTAGNPGDITVANAVTYAGAAARTLTLTANRTVNINQAISSTGGALGLNVSAGTGAVNFGASGSIATNGGALSITSATGGALRGIDFGAGGLTLSSAGNFTQAGGALAGSGTVTKNGTGALTLSRANTYTGATLVNAGTVTVANGSGLGTAAAGTTVNAGATLAMNGLTVASEPLTLNGGTLSRAAGNPTWNGTVNLAATSTVTGAAGTLTIGGAVSGAGGLTKTGAGTVTLSGSNTYSGITTANAGTLRLGDANALGSAAGGTTVNAGGTLAMNGLTVASEPLTLNGGTLSRAAGNPTWNGTVNLAATSTVTGAAGTLTLGNAVSGAGGITKTGAGTLVLSGNNTYGGPTAINAGTVRVAGGNGIGDASAVTLANVGSAVLSLNGTSETIGSLMGGGAAGGNVTLGAGTLTTGGDNSSTTYSGVISGTGGVVKNGTGTLTLTRPNTYSGATMVNGGTLTASNATALGTAASGTTVNAGATLNINGVAIGAEAVTLNGAGVGGAGALQGTGGASLAGAVTLASGSTIGAGPGSTLALNGAVNGPGALDVAGGGTITFGAPVGSATPLASLTQGAATTLNINGGLVSTTGPQTYDGNLATGGATTLQTAGSSIVANGAVTATGGTLNLAAGAGDVTMTNPANDFGTVTVASGGAVDLVDANALVLGAASAGTVRARTLTGDLALNGTVTATDSIILAAGANFVNGAGAAALNPGAGRWIVYSTTPGGNVFGGLASGNQAIWNAAYPTAIAQPGNRYVFSTQPAATFTSTDAGKVYGDDATAAIAGNFTASGFVDAAAFGGVFAQDTLANTFTGAPSVTSAGAPAAADAGTYPIAVGSGTLMPTTGYGTAFSAAGLFTVAPAPLTITADDKTKTAGQPNPPFTATFTGFKLGQTVADLTGALSFTTPATTASPPGLYAITPGGVSSTNYAITFVDGQLVVTAAPIVPGPPNGSATANNALITATQRSVTSPMEGLPPGAPLVRRPECLVLETAVGPRVLNRCF